MQFSRIMSVIVAAAGMAFASLSADAASVSLAFTSVNPGHSETISSNSGTSWITSTAGQLNFNVTNNNSGGLIPGSTISTYCVDIAQYVSTNPNSYTILGPGSYSLPYNNTALITSLYNAYYYLTSDAVNSAAFQLAVWELVNESTVSNPAHLDTGNFRAKDDGNWATPNS